MPGHIDEEFMCLLFIDQKYNCNCTQSIRTGESDPDSKIPNKKH